MIRVEPLIDVKIISNLPTPMKMAHAHGSRGQVPSPTNVWFLTFGQKQTFNPDLGVSAFWRGGRSSAWETEALPLDDTHKSIFPRMGPVRLS